MSSKIELASVVGQPVWQWDFDRRESVCRYAGLEGELAETAAETDRLAVEAFGYRVLPAGAGTMLSITKIRTPLEEYWRTHGKGPR